MFENDRGSLSSPLIGLKTAQTEDQLTTLPTRQSQTSDFVPGAAPGESCSVHALSTCGLCCYHRFPLCDNTTSSSKPEIHNLSQLGHRRTESRP